MSVLVAAEVVSMIRLTTTRLRAWGAELSRLDGVAGDGDHGANVVAAFSAAERQLDASGSSNPRQVFQVVARAWAEAGGGAAGALFATLFDSLAQAVDKDSPQTVDLVNGLEAAARTVRELGRAGEGDKTLVDALAPAARAARSALGTGADTAAVLRDAAIAAESGATATAAMAPKAGLAKYAASGAIGTRDPGAVTVAIMFSAWADASAGGPSPVRTAENVGEALDRLATPSGQFAILALDHVRSFATTMRPHDPDSMTPEAIREWKGRLVDGLASEASAILIDPAFAASLDRTATRAGLGLIVGLEDSDYGSAREAPRLMSGWTVERAARLGADAVKVSFSFALDDDASVTERFVSDLVRECSAAGLPLLCEPLVATGAGQDVRQTVVEGVRRYGGSASMS